MTSYYIRDYATGNGFPCADDETILTAAERNGYEYEYRSRVGSDDTTIAKVISGRCEVEDTGWLSPLALSEGFILIDVARPLTDCVIKFEAYTEWAMFQINPPPVYHF